MSFISFKLTAHVSKCLRLEAFCFFSRLSEGFNELKSLPAALGRPTNQIWNSFIGFALLLAAWHLHVYLICSLHETSVYLQQTHTHTHSLYYPVFLLSTVYKVVLKNEFQCSSTGLFCKRMLKPQFEVKLVDLWAYELFNRSASTNEINELNSTKWSHPDVWYHRMFVTSSKLLRLSLTLLHLMSFGCLDVMVPTINVWLMFNIRSLGKNKWPWTLLGESPVCLTRPPSTQTHWACCSFKIKDESASKQSFFLSTFCFCH